MTAGQLANALEDRMWRGDVLECEVARETCGVQLARAERMLEQRLELRAEEKRAPDVRVVERLLPEAVSREQQPPLRLVPEREREHPVQPLDAAWTEVLVEVDDHLGVRARREAVAACDEVRAQLAVVVDLAVLDYVDRAVLVADRLVPGIEVDDGQPAESERNAGSVVVLGDVKSLVIRPAVLEDAGHPRECVAVDRAGSGDPTDAAHAELARCDRYEAAVSSSKLRRSRTRYTGFASDS